MSTANEIIKNIREVLASDANAGIKIANILILITARNDFKYNSILNTIGTIVHSQIDFGQLEMIFGSSASPNEKVASFFNLLTDGDKAKYDKISEILAS